MRDLDFKPPTGSVYVKYRDNLQEERPGGVVVVTNKPRDFVEGTVEQSNCGSVEAGNRISFARARSHEVRPGVFCVKEDNIAFVYG